MVKPDLKNLELELDHLERSPRETAMQLWKINSDPSVWNPLLLVNMAREYQARLRRPKETPPSILQRDLRALAAHARKLQEGLSQLPVECPNIPTSPLGDYLEPGEWCRVAYPLEDGRWRVPDLDRNSELITLAIYLEWRADHVDVADVGPVRAPIRPDLDWNDENGLALGIASLCRTNNRPFRHALPITKAIIKWAAKSQGANPRPLGKQSWDMVVKQMESTCSLVGKSQRG